MDIAETSKIARHKIADILVEEWNGSGWNGSLDYKIDQVLRQAISDAIEAEHQRYAPVIEAAWKVLAVRRSDPKMHDRLCALSDALARLSGRIPGDGGNVVGSSDPTSAHKAS